MTTTQAGCSALQCCTHAARHGVLARLLHTTSHIPWHIYCKCKTKNGRHPLRMRTSCTLSSTLGKIQRTGQIRKHSSCQQHTHSQ